MIKISVIIPVYNVTSYLTECLTSLVHQTLTAVEFIVVNDGSTDGSDLILESFAQEDPRFRVLHQTNQGVSVARNQGLKLAQGECVAFVDADDFVASDFLEKLYTAYTLHQTQIVTACFTSQVDGQWIPQKMFIPTAKVFTSAEIHHDIIPHFLQADTLNSSCVKLFSRSLIMNNHIIFLSELSNGEDALFCLQAFAKAERIVFIDYSGYHYRQVSGSASRNIMAKNYLQLAIDTFTFDHQSYAQLQLSSKVINRFKSIRLIENLYDLIHIYLQPQSAVAFSIRVKAVRAIIHHPILVATLKCWGKDLEASTNGYRKKMLTFMRKKFLWGILGLTLYSNFRNKQYFSK
jgi:glycosyltransferase involved in cell wall biosynthesis